ncbi:hypothetical protein BLA14095_00485 [Burkholderia lata]|nr:hypothetical protein BLA14095_00485 [Burkholderia lata]
MPTWEQKVERDAAYEALFKLKRKRGVDWQSASHHQDQQYRMAEAAEFMRAHVRYEVACRPFSGYGSCLDA